MPSIITKRDKSLLLRNRVVAIKPILQGIKHWKKQFIELHPEFNNKYSLGLLASTMSLRTSDEDITSKLELFVKNQQK